VTGVTELDLTRCRAILSSRFRIKNDQRIAFIVALPGIGAAKLFENTATARKVSGARSRFEAPSHKLGGPSFPEKEWRFL
jgi:hypothetical protein